jgi:hypothetical protein
MLSVNAAPFHPVHGKEIDSIIYNNGIPCLSFQGTDTEFLHSITDDAIDEAYPPDAQEAAELEAVELFVEMMARLAYLEEREERARGNAHIGLGKRWEARRELVDKPRPAKHSIKAVVHNHQPHDEDVTDLVAFDPNHHFSVKDHKLRERVMSQMARHSMSSNKNNKNMNRQQRIPIQQPRKNS